MSGVWHALTTAECLIVEWSGVWSDSLGVSQGPVVVFNMVPASWAGNDDPQHAGCNYGHWQIQQHI